MGLGTKITIENVQLEDGDSLFVNTDARHELFLKFEEGVLTITNFSKDASMLTTQVLRVNLDGTFTQLEPVATATAATN